MADLDHLSPPAVVRSAGWHPDPAREADLRWWDGGQWTDHTRPTEEDAGTMVRWGLVLGLLFPLGGFIVAIVLLTRNRASEASGVLLASILGTVVWLAITG